MNKLAAAFAVFGALALPGLARAAPPPQVTFATPPPSGGLICSGGYVYSFSMTSGTQYVYLLGGSPCTGNFYPFTITGGGQTTYGRDYAYANVYGGPNSLQFKALRTILDLESIDVEGEDRFTAQGDADTIGGAFTYFGGQAGLDGERLDGQYAKQWRPFEGSRTRALIDAPVQVVDVGGNIGGSGLLSGGFEVPVKTNWSVTGRAGLGGTASAKLYGDDGVLGTVSVSSRYKFPQIGRGDLVLGNAIVYTGESSAGNQNVAFRNGIAYQFPLKQLVFGRQTSVRVSYVNTYIAGDPVGIDLYHEIAVNFGVRLREQDIRSKFEALRVGLLYTNADHYNAVTMTVGYRF